MLVARGNKRFLARLRRRAPAFPSLSFASPYVSARVLVDAFLLTQSRCCMLASNFPTKLTYASNTNNIARNHGREGTRYPKISRNAREISSATHTHTHTGFPDLSLIRNHLDCRARGLSSLSESAPKVLISRAITRFSCVRRHA